MNARSGRVHRWCVQTAIGLLVACSACAPPDAGQGEAAGPAGVATVIPPPSPTLPRGELPTPKVPAPIDGDPYTFDGTAHAVAALAHGVPADPVPDDPDVLLEWRDRARGALFMAFAGEIRPPSAFPLDVRVLGTTQFEGFQRFDIAYFVAPALRTRAFLYVPNTLAAGVTDGATDGATDQNDGSPPARRQAVVFWHGHGVGGHLASDGEPPYDSGPERGGARALAERGWIVLAPTIRSFDGIRQNHRLFGRVMPTIGTPPLSLYVADAFRAVDVLVERTDVDLQTIGMTGVGLGGIVTLVSAALDHRVSAASVHSGLPSFTGSLVRQVRCSCVFSRPLGAQYDLADVAALIAPRRLQVVAGRADDEVPFDEQRAGYARAVVGYRAMAAESAITFAEHEGADEWFDSAAFDWFSGAPSE